VDVTAQPFADLLERTAIREVIQQYAIGLDQRDEELLSSCFTHDAHFVLEGNDAGRGFDAFRAYMRLHSQAMPIRSFGHVIPSVHVTLNGDTATARCQGFSYLILEGDGGNTVRLRGLRYQESLVRTDRWLISEHVHIPIWESHLPVSGGWEAFADR
jgi:SnoaL-like domain